MAPAFYLRFTQSLEPSPSRRGAPSSKITEKVRNGPFAKSLTDYLGAFLGILGLKIVTNNQHA